MPPLPPRRILVPMDLSGPSLSALETAKRLARRFHSRLGVVYVQPPQSAFPPIDPNLAVGRMPDVTRLEDEYARWCAGCLREAVAGFPPSRVSVRTVHGWPAAVLAGLATKRSADLVVMGSHGYHGLDRMLHGSVSEALVRRAAVPVLAVHEARRPLSWGRVLVPVNMLAHSDETLRYAEGLTRALGGRLSALWVSEEPRRAAEER
ncbi:MAG: universal stress protein, partial [Elusimicrobia bacterium]|nr:universal stress protein [Elusimicrobiota bacterium]